MSVPWGIDPSVGNGPPNQWERHVVGAALLLLVAALAVTLTARKVEKPGGLALAIAGLASLGALALALDVRSTSLDNQQGHALLGGGWLWMCAGGCTAIGAVVSAFTLRFRPAPASPAAKPDPAPASQPARPRSGPSKAKKKTKRKRR